MLPGMAPLGMFGGLANVLVFSSTSSLTTAQIAWPAGLRRGDIAILFDESGNSSVSAPTEVVPAGFTKIAGGSAALSRATISYKALDGTETGNITGQTGNNIIRKRLYILRGDTEIGVVSVMPSPNMEATINDPVSQTVPAHSGNASTVVFGFSAGATSGNVAAFVAESPAFAVKETVGTNFLVGYTIYNGDSLGHTVDMNDIGANYLASFYMGFS